MAKIWTIASENLRRKKLNKKVEQNIEEKKLTIKLKRNWEKVEEKKLRKSWNFFEKKLKKSWKKVEKKLEKRWKKFENKLKTLPEAQRTQGIESIT